jgi:DNA-directed RNA polymerase II subunit RPB1
VEQSTPNARSGRTIITDTLPTGQAWDTSAANFISGYDSQTYLNFALTAAPDGTTLSDFAGDAFIDSYLVVGNTLYVNAGHEPRSRQVNAVAVATKIPVGQGFKYASGDWAFNVQNTASFDWSAGDDVTRDGRVDLKQAPGPDRQHQLLHEAHVRPDDRDRLGRERVGAYQFNIQTSAGKISDTTIVDHIDHNVFDVTSANLDQIRATIATDFSVGDTRFYSNIGWSIPLDADDFVLSLNADGDLVIAPSQTLLDFLAQNPSYESTHWRVALKLPTKKLDGTQTVQLRNDASLVGSKNGIEFVSKTDSYATTWGDELEVRKSVWDAATSQWTTSVRVPSTMTAR